MRIAILDGDPESTSAFGEYLCEVVRQLESKANSVTTLPLRKLKLKGCSGCFGCWVKTPGECVRRDDSREVCRAALQADLLLLASPLKMGFTTALLKRAVEQMLGLLHPYFVMDGAEVHHRARYSHYPKFGLLLDPGGDSDAEDVEITKALWARTAHNMKSSLVFTALSNCSATEVAHEIALVA